MKDLFNDKKKVILLAIATIAVILVGILLALGIKKAVNFLNPPKELSEKDEVLIQMGVPKDEIGDMDETEKDQIIKDQYYERTIAKDYIFKEGREEFSNKESNEKKVIYTYLGSLKFSDIITKMDSLTSKYNFTTTENRELVQIYKDAQMLTKVYGLSEMSYANVMQNCISPTVLTVIYLNAPTKVVKDVTVADNAKFPLYQGNINVGETVKLEGEELQNDNHYIDYEPYIIKGEDIVYKTVISGSGSTKRQTTVSCYVANNPVTEELSVLGCYVDSGYALFVDDLTGN